jgi:hypothetical protein
MGCTMVSVAHAPWVVQHYPFPTPHGLYNAIRSPWVMGCTTLSFLHGAWVVQHYPFPMGHGLYNATHCQRAEFLSLFQTFFTQLSPTFLIPIFSYLISSLITTHMSKGKDKDKLMILQMTNDKGHETTSQWS